LEKDFWIKNFENWKKVLVMRLGVDDFKKEIELLKIKSKNPKV
jgi:hypothetical protein